MKKILLIGQLIVAALLLGGCMIISCEERGTPRRPCAIGGPSWRVGVIYLPHIAEADASASPLCARP